jgi:hypothetical protein
VQIKNLLARKYKAENTRNAEKNGGFSETAGWRPADHPGKCDLSDVYPHPPIVVPAADLISRLDAVR